MKLTLSRLIELLNYDLLPGCFTWRCRRGPKGAGAAAGSVNGRGYLRIMIDGQEYLAHRLAFFVTHGRWPEGEIDHRNRHRTANHFGNLREATHSQNRMNSSVQRNNQLQVKGVRKRKKHYEARIQVGGRPLFVGSFPTLDKAREAYRVAQRQYHGCFAPDEVARMAPTREVKAREGRG